MSRQKAFKQLEFQFGKTEAEPPATPEVAAPRTPEAETSEATMGGADFADIVGTAPEGESPEAAPEPGAAEPVVSPAEPVAPEVASAKFRVGSQTFDSQAEADAYVAQLESERAYRQGLIDSVTPVAPTEPVIDPADIIFEDPKKAMDLLRKQIRDEYAAEKLAESRKNEATQAVRNVWDGFYSAHPDLAANRELVDMVATLPASQESFGKLPISKALPELAKAVRAYKAKLKNETGGEELPSDPAVTSGTGGVKIPVTKAPTRVLSFVDEIRQLKRK